MSAETDHTASKWTHAFKRPQLRRVVRAVASAASTDPGRSDLCGVHLHREPGKDQPFTIAATDSYRLHVATLSLDVKPIDAIVPAEWLLRWAAVDTPATRLGTVDLSIGGNWATLTFDDETSSTRLIQTTYPNYRDLLASEAAREEVAAAEIAVRPTYLAAILEAADIFGGGVNAAIQTRLVTGAARPISFRVDNERDRLDMMLMPIRLAHHG